MNFYTTRFVFAIAILQTAFCVMAQPAAGPPAAPKKIELECGQHKITITCGKVLYLGDPKDARQCNHNTLSFTGKNDKVFVPKQPKNFRQEFVVDKTPVSMTCAQGKDQKYYVTVEFSACPLGADYASCVTYDLFASDGRRLTVNSRNLDSIQALLAIPYTKHIRLEGDIKLHSQLIILDSSSPRAPPIRKVRLFREAITTILSTVLPGVLREIPESLETPVPRCKAESLIP